MFGEFALIVVGVLVALMVETALEERHDGELRDEYYARLGADIATDKQAAEYRITFFSAVEQFSERTLSWLATDTPVDQQVLLESFYAAELLPFVPTMSTYEDLLSTGNIRLIDDIDIRTHLAAYYNRADASRDGWNPSEDYRERIRGIIPPPIQNQIRRNCPTTDKFDQVPTGFPPCELRNIDYDVLTALYQPLKGDAAIREMLTYRSSELAVMNYLLAQQVAFASEVLMRIKTR
jgi:hypothetical protein